MHILYFPPSIEKVEIVRVISPSPIKKVTTNLILHSSLEPNTLMAILNHASSFEPNKTWDNLTLPTKQKKGYP